MNGRLSRWGTSVGVAAVAAVGLLSVGCGAYEEADYPRQYYVAPAPPTAEELAGQQLTRQQATAENREILIGEDEDEYADTDPRALTDFRPALEGHGVWVDDSTYGTVWVPSSAEVGTEFQPYVTAGHWTYSDATDYVWVSDYSWGWAPFHYGRWVQLPGHGWAWIPGRRYAGAWVTWRVGPSGYGYIGWAPMAPSWYWYRGSASGWTFGHYHHYDHYVYCSHDRLYQGAVSTHVVRGPEARVHDGRTQDYVTASPSVGGGGRVAANPGVDGPGGDRVVAHPNVDSGNAVVANPGLGRVAGSRGGRTPATPSVARGPRPSDFGVNNETVVAPPTSNPGIERAQSYAFPKQRDRVIAPATFGTSVPTEVRPSVNTTNPGPVYRGPASSSLVPRSTIAATPRPSVEASPRPSMSSMPPPFASSPAFRPASPSTSSPSAASAMSPGLSSGPSLPAFGPTPTFRPSSPAVTASPVFRPSSPTVRASPSLSFRSPPPSAFSSRAAAPMVRSPSISAAPIRSAPSFRAAAPSVRSPGLSSAPSRSYSSPAVRSMGRGGRR